MNKQERLAIIRQHYPNAITTNDLMERVIDYFGQELGLEPNQILFADSICADDVNSVQYPARARELLGPFRLGGLDGFPFVGSTGMGAFADHVPDEGAIFIYYGPHIGVSKAGTLGEICRTGQHKPSGSCGAAKAALANLQAGRIMAGQVSEMDYQMNTLEQILLRQKDRILTAISPLHEATEVIYKAIDARIRQLVADTAFRCRYVLLMGAILINGDTDMGSFSTTKQVDLLDLSTGNMLNLSTVFEA
jgi:hypothetical protein